MEPKLVRGLDYYRHTTFEYQGGTLDSAQNALGGGGRYDGLLARLGVGRHCTADNASIVRFRGH